MFNSNYSSFKGHMHVLNIFHKKIKTAIIQDCQLFNTINTTSPGWGDS